MYVKIHPPEMLVSEPERRCCNPLSWWIFRVRKTHLEHALPISSHHLRGSGEFLGRAGIAGGCDDEKRERQEEERGYQQADSVAASPHRRFFPGCKSLIFHFHLFLVNPMLGIISCNKRAPFSRAKDRNLTQTRGATTKNGILTLWRAIFNVMTCWL